MASDSGSTGYRLTIFLLSIAVLLFATLTWQYFDKSRQLAAQVETLQASQVMLMVPEQHAAAIARWMEQHPQQTASLLEVIKPVAEGQLTPQQALELQQASGKQDAKASLAGIAPQPLTQKMQNVSEAPAKPQSEPQASRQQNGINVVPTQHGGVIITTRDVTKN